MQLCTSSQENRTGICVLSAICSQQGGTPQGNCPGSYFAVCCVFVKTCQQETRANTSYFVGSNSTLGCKVLIHKLHPQDVCQIRLDLVDFVLSPPIFGQCNLDFLLVEGGNENFVVPTICGLNSGQHLIVPVDRVSGPLAVTVYASDKSELIPERLWNIKITQLTCHSRHIAPPGCLQFFSTSSGLLQSFNYNQTNPVLQGEIAGLNYAICIHQNVTSCGASFRSQGEFRLGSNATTSSVDGDCHGIFLQFPPSHFESTTGMRATPSRICGGVFSPIGGATFPSPLVAHTRGPLVVYVQSSKVGDLSRGFQLRYDLLRCCTSQSRGLCI